MSDLLQRLIDRTKEPLSAVQPILPSIYTPADRAENDGAAISQENLAPEPAAHSSSSPAERAGKHGAGEASPPPPGEPVAARTSPAAPTPVRHETGAPASQQTSRPVPPGQDASVTPPAVEKTFQPPAAPLPIKSKLAAAEKAEDKGSVTRTFVPQNFGSKVAKSSAKREDAGASPGLGGSAFKPAISIHQDSGNPAQGINPDLPSPQTKPPGAGTVPPTGHDAAAKASRNKFMPSLAATMKWLGTKETPGIEPEPLAKTTGMGQGHRPESPEESSFGKTSTSPGSEAAPPRENKNTQIVRPADAQALPTRRSESPAGKASQASDRIPPVEVNVSIGHIEVKSAQPSPPAPRRAPQRPRISLEQFLKSPHSGGLT